jgi:NTP pyrophosphatase (non-canonical NTP hydrolase)
MRYLAGLGEDVMTFEEAIELFRSVYRRFEQIEGRPWGVEGALMELTKQAGELAKHVMVAEHYYFPGKEHQPGYETSREIIADELADIFAMLIRIADHYDIDLAEAHVRARRAESAHLASLGL